MCCLDDKKFDICISKSVCVRCEGVDTEAKPYFPLKKLMQKKKLTYIQGEEHLSVPLFDVTSFGDANG